MRACVYYCILHALYLVNWPKIISTLAKSQSKCFRKIEIALPICHHPSAIINQLPGKYCSHSLINFHPNIHSTKLVTREMQEHADTRSMKINNFLFHNSFNVRISKMVVSKTTLQCHQLCRRSIIIIICYPFISTVWKEVSMALEIHRSSYFYITRNYERAIPTEETTDDNNNNNT